MPTRKIPAKDFITFHTPDFYFQVQRAFQQEGVTFINPPNGALIKGVINCNTLGMTSAKAPPPAPAHIFGFPVKHHQDQPQITTPTLQNFEASLEYFQIITSEQPAVFKIQVIKDSDLKKWQKIAYNVGQKFIFKPERAKRIPLCIFEFTTLADPDPNDPTSAMEAVLGRMQGYRGQDTYTYAVSKQPIRRKR